MSTQRQLRRGTTAECNAMTPALGELILDTTLSQLRIGDGSTAGGILIPRLAGNLSQFAATTSAQLASILSDETGSGAAVFGTAPTLSAAVLAGTTNLSGGQITFPASQSASSDANTLDDYEEGTWTPAYVTDGVNFTSITYDAFTGGRYIKIGKSVFIQFTVRTDAVTVGSASGSLRISGLPFASVANSGSTFDGWSALSVSFSSLFTSNPLAANVRPDSSLIGLSTRPTFAGDTTDSAYTALATGANTNFIICSGTYTAAA